MTEAQATSMAAGVPYGAIIAFAGDAVPAGWLRCNGDALSRVEYAQLFAAIGTTYGSTDDTTFKLPDLRGEFVRGSDCGRGIDPERTLGSAQDDAIRNITGEMQMHLMGAVADTHRTEGAFAKGDTFAQSNMHSGTYWHTSRGPVSFDASRVVPTAEENRPRNVALHYCIKAKDITA